jgi:hypothetical protein
VNYVKDLRETANEVKAIFEEITGSKPPPKTFLSDGELGANGTMGVTDENQSMASSSSITLVKSSTLPSKMRRKVSQRQAKTVGEQIPTQTELDDVLCWLQRLETMAETLQNDTIQHGHDITEEFEERLASKVEGIRAKRIEELQFRDEMRREHEVATAAKIKSMKEDVDVTDAQVGELAGDIGDMILKVDRLQAELEKQKGERHEKMKRISEVGFFHVPRCVSFLLSEK